MAEVTQEQIDAFLSGSDPMERIIKIECGYEDDKVSIIYRNEKGEKRIKRDNFYPFLWTKEETARSLFGGDRKLISLNMNTYGIGAKQLRVNLEDGTIPERMKNGYHLMFYAKVPMTYNRFLDFFKKSGRSLYPNPGDINYGLKEYISVSPVEQYMIETGRRQFKGYDDYDDLLRMEWDLETEGLEPETDAISQIGIRTNKGFEKILTIEGNTSEEKSQNEFTAICDFFKIIHDIQPDIISGHNTENFDWHFIDVRLGKRGVKMGDFSKKYFRQGVYKKKKQQVLKLGGEMEYFFPTVMPGTHLTDSLFAVRRAMALDSNMKSANLKYATRYLKLVKDNRVYVPGKVINDTWLDLTPTYAFNDANGHWFKVDDELLEKTIENGNKRYEVFNDNDGKKKILDHESNETFEFVTGRYIVQRYLLDDLWETDKVELRMNQSNFLVSKMLPVSFDKVCTMGTAAIWKYIMLAWSYEHGLGIPDLIQQHSFTGGLSRLLKVGYVDRIVKLDYNSLYPSIILTFGIKTDIDVMDAMSEMLNYILTQREHYKGLKNKYGGMADELSEELKKKKGTLTDKEISEIKSKIKEYKMLKTRNDKLQLPLKVTGNGFFGSYGSGSIFPWSDLTCAERTTCTGRQMLRLMIGHFTGLGYTPIVGDSFTADTPLFIKYDNGFIDIKPISGLINENEIKIDVLGREYDYSQKNYKVLCRSGWVEPSYIYRHKTNKNIYSVEDNEGTYIEITEDHSLYNSDKEKIKPSQITQNTVLEKWNNEIVPNRIRLQDNKIVSYAKFTALHPYKIPCIILNSDSETCKKFLLSLKLYVTRDINLSNFSKTFIAGIKYIENHVM